MFVVPRHVADRLLGQTLHQFACGKHRELVGVYFPNARRYLGQPRWSSFSNSRYADEPTKRVYTHILLWSWCNIQLPVMRTTKRYQTGKVVEGCQSFVVEGEYEQLIPRKVNRCL